MRDWSRSISLLLAAVALHLGGMMPSGGAQPLSESPEDLQGGVSIFFFFNLRESLGLSDRPFTFDIPRNADVIDTTASGAFR